MPECEPLAALVARLRKAADDNPGAKRALVYPPDLVRLLEAAEAGGRLATWMREHVNHRPETCRGGPANGVCVEHEALAAWDATAGDGGGK